MPRNTPENRICAACGKSFVCSASSSRSTCSPECTEKLRLERVRESRRNHTFHEKSCAVCGENFKCPPSRARATCSPECQSIWRSTALRSARRRPPDQPMPIDTNTAPPRNPRAGKTWTLVDPKGQEHVVTNLSAWARGHYELFDMPATESSVSAIHRGFTHIGQKLRLNPEQTVYYKGWTLKGPPRSQEDF